MNNYENIARKQEDFCTKCDRICPYIIRFGLGVSWNECLGCGRTSDWLFQDDQDIGDE